MKLLPVHLRRHLPALNSTRWQKRLDTHVYAKFYFPTADWTWFITEGQPFGIDFQFFGYEVGINAKWKRFWLSDLRTINVDGFRVERDLYFTPGRFEDVIKRFRKERGY